MKNILDMYISKTEALLNELKPMAKADAFFPKVRELVSDMQKVAEESGDEMLYPTLYNAAATIATAPEGCSVRQLSDALRDAMLEMDAMKEYF